MKLLVAGCSFSDRTHVIKSYGDYLSEIMGATYIHEGAGCGSNARMWRVVTNAIMNGSLTSNDLLIVQYTQITRNEFWTTSEDPSLSQIPIVPNKIRAINPRDSFSDDGDILRYKPGSHAWQKNKNERDFFKMKEEHHTSNLFSFEQSKIQNFNFQHMLKINNIPVIFLKALNYGYEIHNDNYFEFIEYSYTDQMLAEKNHDLTDSDPYHVNQRGHEFIADELYKIYTNSLEKI